MLDETAKTFPPSDDFKAKTFLNQADYEAMYAASVADPDAFWGEHGKRIDWMTPYTTVKNVSYAHPDVSIKWYVERAVLVPF
ncbi:MAG: acetyl-coenzyme A synthetase N-terminal domain-containing protein, partial [Pseudomonadota bacterium]